MKKIFLISIIFLTFSCVNLGTLKSNYGSGELILPKQQKDRFLNYLSGEYFSKEFDRKENEKVPIAFAISKDGMKSVMLMCDETIGDKCGSGIFILQTIAKYSKISGSKLHIFAIRNKIVWNNANMYINENASFQQYLKKNNLKKKFEVPNKNLQFYDQIFVIDGDGCDEKNC